MIASWVIDTFPLDAPPKHIREVLVEGIIHFGVSGNQDSYELAARWQRAFCRKLIDHHNERVVNGRHVRFSFNESDQEYLQGSAFASPIDDELTVSAKWRRKQHSECLDALVNLTADEFEVACAGLIRAIGAIDAYTTRHSGDSGIDFFGRLPLTLLSSIQLSNTVYQQMQVWLVGQAKHYQRTQVATPDIRELIGSVELAKSGTFVKPGQYPELDVRVCDPVYYLFFTTGQISKDGWKLIEASGVIAMEGDDVAAFMADHGIGFSDNNFDQAVFRDWIQGIGSH